MPVGGAIVRALYTHRPRVCRMCRMCRTCRVVAAPSGQRAKAMQRRARAMRERADAHGIFDPAVNRLRASSACLCELHRSASAEGLREVRSAAPHKLVLNPNPHPHPDPNPDQVRSAARQELVLNPNPHPDPEPNPNQVRSAARQELVLGLPFEDEAALKVAATRASTSTPP